MNTTSAVVVSIAVTVSSTLSATNAVDLVGSTVTFGAIHYRDRRRRAAGDIDQVGGFIDGDGVAVAETGRTALTDMRRMLGLLGSGDGAAFTPQPGTGDIHSLLEVSRAAGLPITITRTGVAPVDSAQQLVIYRIVQESLTNVLRHASSVNWVRVELRYDAHETTIEIANDGT